MGNTTTVWDIATGNVSGSVTNAQSWAIVPTLSQSQVQDTTAVTGSSPSGASLSRELMPYGWRSVQTEYNDTMQRIAIRELQDASRWPEIVWINNLVPPYITNVSEQVRKGVILAGKTILVPSSPGTRQNATPEASFGIDILLNGGCLRATNHGDLDLAAGVPNLRQALNMRLRAEKGDLAFHPRYGNAAQLLRGTKAIGNVHLLALRYCEECILADPRVLHVRDGISEVLGDAISVGLTAVIDDGSILKFQIEI